MRAAIPLWGTSSMADLIDDACEVEQRSRDAAIKAALDKARANRLNPKGSCYNCAEQLQPMQLFCDADCSADHELRQRAQRY